MDRLLALGVSQITFGGGEPMAHRGIRDLLRYARSQAPDLKIHLDTNGTGLETPSRVGELAGTVDMIGFGLDAADAATQAETRGNESHFTRALRSIRSARSGGFVVKINSVLTQANVGNAMALAELVVSLEPDVWSIYEFWPIGPIARHNRAALLVPHEKYVSTIAEIRARYPGLHTEPSSISDRDLGYFLVTEMGDAYIAHGSTYLSIGSVFEDGVVDRWGAHSDPDLHRTKAEARRILMEGHRVD